MNGSTWYYDRSSQRLGGGGHEVEQISALSANVDNVVTMVQKLAQITLQNKNGRQIPKILAIEDPHRDFKGKKTIEEFYHNNLYTTKDFKCSQQDARNTFVNQASTSSTKVTGKLPACPKNQREHVNAIVIKSGKKLEEPPPSVDKSMPSKIIDVEIEEKLDQ
nr:(-)-alpha-terpineol synthase-like [Ipomoea batatas]